MNSFTNVRTTQVFSLLADGVLGIIYTIISTVLQVLIIKAMSKLSKVSAKLSPTSDFREYYAGYFVPAGVQVRTLTCSAGENICNEGLAVSLQPGTLPAPCLEEDRQAGVRGECEQGHFLINILYFT